MQCPFKIYFAPAEWPGLSSEGRLPDGYSYNIPISVPLFRSCEKGEFFTQSVRGEDYWIELWSFKVFREGYFEMIVEKPFLFFSVALKGALTLGKDTLIGSGCYNMHYLPFATQRFHVTPGDHTLGLFIPPMHFLRGITIENNSFADLFKRVQFTSSKAISLHSCRYPKRVLRIIKELQQTSTEGFSLHLDLQRYMLEIVSLYCRQQHQLNTSINYGSTSHEKSFAAKQYILAHLSSVPVAGLKEIARQFYSTPKTLNREFKKLTGKTVSAFIRDEKLTWAKHLIEVEQLSTSEVSLLTGYSETANFIRAYKARFRHTPKKQL